MRGFAVVFLAGGGMSGLYYWNVHDLVAEFTTSVSYDRLGLGWSDAVELPRSGAQVTDDLRELLRVASVPGPCVLVGHSLGGLYARLYAKRFPGEVAGMVLLDPTHEDVVGYLPEEKAQRLRDSNTDDLFPPEQLDAMRTAYRAAFGRAKHRLYTDLAAVSPRAEVRRLDDAGHLGIAWLRPDAVVQAIRDTLSR